MRVPDIKRHSGRVLGLSPAAMDGRTGRHRTAHRRQIAMTACRLYSSHSLPKIGQEFGGRHHTTVMHALEKVEARCAGDPDFFNMVAKVCAVMESEILHTLKARQARLESTGTMPPVALLPPPNRPWLWTGTPTSRRIFVQVPA